MSFLAELQAWGLEHFGRFYGLYRGVVQSNADPEGRGRVQVLVPAVGHRPGHFPQIWVEPSFPGAGVGRGQFWPPEVGDPVWVSFNYGNSSSPSVYLGGWVGAADDSTDRPSELETSGSPKARGFFTRMGHSLQFIDEADKESVKLIWHQPDPADPALTDNTKTADRTKGKSAILSFSKDGILLMNQNGTCVELSATDAAFKVFDEHGNVLSSADKGWTLVAADGSVITLVDGLATIMATKGMVVSGESVNLKVSSVFLCDGADTPGVRGTDLITYLAGHLHPTGVGMSGPPSQPPPPGILSKNVKLK